MSPASTWEIGLEEMGRGVATQEQCQGHSGGSSALNTGAPSLLTTPLPEGSLLVIAWGLPQGYDTNPPTKVCLALPLPFVEPHFTQGQRTPQPG